MRLIIIFIFLSLFSCSGDNSEVPSLFEDKPNGYLLKVSSKESLSNHKLEELDHFMWSLMSSYEGDVVKTSHSTHAYLKGADAEIWFSLPEKVDAEIFIEEREKDIVEYLKSQNIHKYEITNQRLK